MGGMTLPGWIAQQQRSLWERTTLLVGPPTTTDGQWRRLARMITESGNPALLTRVDFPLLAILREPLRVTSIYRGGAATELLRKVRGSPPRCWSH